MDLAAFFCVKTDLVRLMSSGKTYSSLRKEKTIDNKKSASIIYILEIFLTDAIDNITRNSIVEFDF